MSRGDDGLSSKNDEPPIAEAKLARLERGERGSSCEDSPNIEGRTSSLDDEQRGESANVQGVRGKFPSRQRPFAL